MAVTPQFTKKARVDPLAKEAKVNPPAVNKFGNNPTAGHTPLPVGVQLATLHASPALGMSLISAPSAAAGPPLLNVRV